MFVDDNDHKRMDIIFRDFEKDLIVGPAISGPELVQIRRWVVNGDRIIVFPEN